jgi:oligopeptide transport system substrate-binding protein
MIDSADTGFTLFQNGEIDYIDLTESNLITIYENADHEFHDNLVELRPTKYSYQYHWNYNKYNEDGTVDTNYNTAIANEAFRKSIYWGFDQTAWMQRTNSINPLKCENNAYTMKGLIYDSEGKDYIDLVNEKLETPLGAYNGESMVRYDAEKGAALKAQAIEELTALGVEFPIHIAYYIQGSNQTSLDSATVLKNSLESSLGEDYICLDIKTYVSSFSKEVRNSKLHSLVVNGWGADYGDPMNYLGQEIKGYDNAWYSNSYSNINDVPVEDWSKDLHASYDKFTEMVWAADAITTDLDARYNAFADAEAYMIEECLVMPYNYGTGYCLTKINLHSQMNAMFGSCNPKFKNWETKADEPYTQTEWAEIIANKGK